MWSLLSATDRNTSDRKAAAAHIFSAMASSRQFQNDPEEVIGRELLHLACRHCISEMIMLEKVVNIYSVLKSPKIELFGHFKDC